MTFQLAVLSASHPWSCCPSKKIFCCSSAHQCNYSWGIWFISQLLKTRMLRHSLIGGASQWWCWCVSINSVSCAITRRSKKGRQTKSSMNTPPTTSHSSYLHRIPPQLCKQILVADVCKKFPHLQITNWLHSEEVKTFPLFGKQTSLVSPCNLSISIKMLCQSIKDLSDP